MSLGKLFKNGITPIWLHTLAYGETYLFDEYGIVSMFIDDNGYAIINSGTANNINFTRQMIRLIMTLAKPRHKVGIAHHGKGINGIERYGFVYNSDLNLYIKDKKWDY